MEYAALATAFFRIAPNGKVPPKTLQLALLAEHTDRERIFASGNTARADAAIWGAHIRTVLVKYRDLVQSPPKLAVIERQATSECVDIVKVVIYIYIYIYIYMKQVLQL